MASARSARVATTGLTSEPVTARMSSTAKTLAGSAIATTSLPSSKPTGIAEWRRRAPGSGAVEPSTANRSGRRSAGRPGWPARHQLGLGEHALLDEDPPERAADALLLLVGGLELGGADSPPSSRMSPSCFTRRPS